MKTIFNEISILQAHDHAIKCLAMDPHEEFFVTGSADGDIKVRAPTKQGSRILRVII